MMTTQHARVGIFIDRDGVLNHEVKHPELVDAQGRACSDVLTPEEFVLFDGVQEAFEKIKKSGALSLIVSNQVGFAKGFVNQEMLNAIRQKMVDLLHPDGVYYCLHHEDYTGSCDCKKPKKGLLLQAAKEHNVDITKSYMIGDRRIDMQTGSDCKRCFLVNSREGENVFDEWAKLDFVLRSKVTVVQSFAEAIDIILQDLRGELDAVFEAIIPCAGRGTRMGELTDEIPKAMISFDGIPFLQFIMQHLVQNGIRRFIIPVGYLGHCIKEYFGDGSKFGVEIVYAQSSVEVETGGSFKRALPYVQGNSFLMYYGDSYYPYDLSSITQHFVDSKKTMMFVCQQRPKVEGFEDKSNLVVDESLNVLAYDKKNTSGNATMHDVGVLYFTRDIIKYCEPDIFILDQHVTPLLAHNTLVCAYLSANKSIGMGNPQKIERFKKYLEEHKDVFPKVKRMGRESDCVHKHL